MIQTVTKRALLFAAVVMSAFSLLALLDILNPQGEGLVAEWLVIITTLLLWVLYTVHHKYNNHES